LAAYQATMPPLEDLAIEQVAHGEDPSATKTTGPRWRCRVCGYVHCGDEPPDECPYCFFPATAFKAV